MAIFGWFLLLGLLAWATSRGHKRQGLLMRACSLLERQSRQTITGIGIAAAAGVLAFGALANAEGATSLAAAFSALCVWALIAVCIVAMRSKVSFSSEVANKIRETMQDVAASAYKGIATTATPEPGLLPKPQRHERHPVLPAPEPVVEPMELPQDLAAAVTGKGVVLHIDGHGRLYLLDEDAAPANGGEPAPELEQDAAGSTDEAAVTDDERQATAEESSERPWEREAAVLGGLSRPAGPVQLGGSGPGPLASSGFSYRPLLVDSKLGGSPAPEPVTARREEA